MNSNVEEPAIQLSGLRKKYGDFEALKGLELEVEPGEVFGFLGPNGAGKTTTIQLLMGMLIPTGGSARILGWDCQDDSEEVKRRTGYLPDQPEFYDYMTGKEILNFASHMHGLSKQQREDRIQTLLEDFELLEASSEFAINYSAGMKQKLALARAQLHEPSVYLLDEPTTSLDPAAARDVREWIQAASSSGCTIFLCTHRMELAEELCTQVGILHEGEIRSIGTPAELEAKLTPGGDLEDVFFEVTGEAEDKVVEKKSGHP